MGTLKPIDYFTTNYPFKDNTIATEKKVIINLGCNEREIMGPGKDKTLKLEKKHSGNLSYHTI